MDTIIRGLKQMSTGLCFTVDREIATTPVYTAYKGRYKDKKVTVLKYKNKYAEAAVEAFPLMKHITNPILAKVYTSQRSGSSFYIILERVQIMNNNSKYSLFFRFIRRKIDICNRKMQNEHSIKIVSLDADKIEECDIYATEEGRPVVCGALPRFTQDPVDISEEEDEICKLDEEIEKYAALSKAEQMNAHDLLRSCAQYLPPQYSLYIAKTLIQYISSEKEELERKMMSARAALLLNTDVAPVSLLFEVKSLPVRSLCLKTLRETKGITKELVNLVFPAIDEGILISDEAVKIETIETVPFLIKFLAPKQKEKILSKLGAVIKKGRVREKEKATDLILNEHIELLDVSSTLYSCMGCMVQSTDVIVKKKGLLLVEKLKEIIEIRMLVQEVIPLVSVQCAHAETAEQAVALLCTLSEIARKEVDKLKASDKWKVPGISILTKPSPIKIDSKALQKEKKRREKEKSCWDNQEW